MFKYFDAESYVKVFNKIDKDHDGGKVFFFADESEPFLFLTSYWLQTFASRG